MTSLRPLIFSFNFILSSSHKTRAKLLTTPSFVKTPLSTSTPMPHTASTNRPLSFCSPIKGLPIIGTWAGMLSMMELYPKWVMNTPTASWAKTSVCGAQGTILPFSLLFSTNPSGKYTFKWSLRDQRNLTRLASSPWASAKISLGLGLANDPKLTYATELASC
uniref:Uncharacterized protein n=1 Tax=Opuntia streptacantha TaxID=393608 RepID=A0A7C9A6R1_OPUST